MSKAGRADILPKEVLCCLIKCCKSFGCVEKCDSLRCRVCLTLVQCFFRDVNRGSGAVWASRCAHVSGVCPAVGASPAGSSARAVGGEDTKKRPDPMRDQAVILCCEALRGSHLARCAAPALRAARFTAEDRQPREPCRLRCPRTS